MPRRKGLPPPSTAVAVLPQPPPINHDALPCVGGPSAARPSRAPPHASAVKRRQPPNLCSTGRGSARTGWPCADPRRQTPAAGSGEPPPGPLHRAPVSRRSLADHCSTLPSAGVPHFARALLSRRIEHFMSDKRSFRTFYSGFNPLTGIRCFLTGCGQRSGPPGGDMFQSPHGDSLFSERRMTKIYTNVVGLALQSPHGDSLFSDGRLMPFGKLGEAELEFQSPHGDSLFSDTLEKVDGWELTKTAKFQSPHGDSLFPD